MKTANDEIPSNLSANESFESVLDRRRRGPLQGGLSAAALGVFGRPLAAGRKTKSRRRPRSAMIVIRKDDGGVIGT
jgi:hypothetical protein